MVDSAVVVYVMDLAGMGIGVEGRSVWLCVCFFFFFFFLSSHQFSLLLLIDGLWWWWIVDHGWDLLRLMDVVGLIWWIVTEIWFDFFSRISSGGWDLVRFWVLWRCLRIRVVGFGWGWDRGGGGGFCGGGDGGFVVGFLLWFVVVVLVQCGAWVMDHWSWVYVCDGFWLLQWWWCDLWWWWLWWVVVATMVVMESGAVVGVVEEGIGWLL